MRLILMSDIAISDLIAQYDLKQHPEGGYFKETYRSAGSIPAGVLPKSFIGNRSYSTAIYFLLPKGARSSLHRIRQDEVWHFYLGSSLTLVSISPTGCIQTVLMGPDVKSGHKLQHVVSAGDWFGAYPNDDSAYSFVGCTVAPGFDFADFEMGQREHLLKEFPHAEEIIVKLTDARPR